MGAMQPTSGGMVGGVAAQPTAPCVSKPQQLPVPQAKAIFDMQ